MEKQSAPKANLVPLLALLGGNVALALGSWFVRLADCGPVSSAFWRLALALPLLALLARRAGQPLGGLGWKAWAATVAAGAFFAADLAAWHVGILMTKLGNATLFGNSGSVILIVWGFVVWRRWPRAGEWLALGVTLAGAAMLLGRSVEIGTRTLAGDLFCILAGFLYVVYLLLIRQARGDHGGWVLLFHASLAGAPLLALTGLALGERLVPQVWWPVFALALGSQVIGQGLLVYALRHFSPLVLGLVLLTQPAVAVLVGWLAFDETLDMFDAVGMVLVSAGLVLARKGESAEPEPEREPASLPA